MLKNYGRISPNYVTVIQKEYTFLKTTLIFVTTTVVGFVTTISIGIVWPGT